MNTEHNTPQAPSAMLTEVELFAEFMQSEFVEYDKFGRQRYRHIVAELLRAEDGYCYDSIQIDLQMHHADDDPSYHLEMVEGELAGVLADVRLAREAYERLKADRLLLPEEPADADEEALEAWEDACNQAEENPRYRPAAVVTDAQEAA